MFKMAKPVMQVSPSDLLKMEKAFHVLSDSLKRNVQRKILTAVATEIKKEYRKNTPQSSRTGSYKAWSKATADRRNGGANQLKKSIKSKPSSKWKNKQELARRGILGVTAGYDYTRGAAKAAPYAHLVNDGHVAVYWGRKGGGRVKGINWQREAQEAAAMKSRGIVLVKARKAVIAAVAKAKKGGR
tara:strand:- start:7606 stop:8163 length:558 start_codon:yes stop_codon:yes gene_type:complete